MDFNCHMFRNDIIYNVIDDIALHYVKLKRRKELIGAQRDWQSNFMYGELVQIKGGIPALVLCNPDPESSYSEFLEKCDNLFLREWTRQNARFEFISPLHSTGSSETTLTPD
ncbi:hypothetical protein IHE45_11G019300 [Dioscorea alata]|uniref:Uncharacterized protein n=1 Tax=Dioscorea alata TaxID=55571 RepID=A0ACB7V582_DIOAL|nr:hypothetical protein IHE45_11G019300 [Dioscorea alata]